MKTRITELFQVKHPIIQGGMHYVGFAEMAAAVSNAGGLGIITGLTQKTPVDLAAEIARCHDMTDKPFGVNLTFLPGFENPPYNEYIAAIIDGGVKIVETAGRSPEAYMPAMKAADIKVIHKCTSVRHGLKAESIGCDAISMDGFECAGHPGEDDVTNLVLLPIARDKIKIPMIASGGLGDARGLVAVLALGAEGMNMGTRFMATKEAPIHDNVKQQMVENDERATEMIFRTLNNTARVASNNVSREVVSIEAKGNATIDDVAHLVSGQRGKVVFENGDTEHGIWSAGMIQGLIHDVPSCKELVERIMDEANQIINRLNTLSS